MYILSKVLRLHVHRPEIRHESIGVFGLFELTKLFGNFHDRHLQHLLQRQLYALRSNAPRQAVQEIHRRVSQLRSQRWGGGGEEEGGGGSEVEWAPIHTGAPMRFDVSLSTGSWSGDFLQDRHRANALHKDRNHLEFSLDCSQPRWVKQVRWERLNHVRRANQLLKQAQFLSLRLRIGIFDNGNPDQIAHF